MTWARWAVSSDRFLSATLLVLFALLIAALCSPLLVGKVHVLDDLGNVHVPYRSVYQEALRAGQGVLWSPYFYGGMYLHAEGQAGMYHPAHQLLYRLLPLDWAFTLELVLSYVFMFPGMYLFLRRLELPTPAALFGAMVFTFSGFNLLHFMHVNAIAVVAHIPWLLLAIDVLLRSTDARQTRLAQTGVALGTGSQLLIGHPQFVWLSVLGELAFAAWRLPQATSLWRLGLLGWAMGLGVMLGGIQLLPTIQALAESGRSNPSAEFRASYSLHVANLLQLVSPYGLKGRVVGGNVQEFGLYNGATCSVAIGWLILRRHALGRWRSLVLGLVLFSAIMVLLAFGPAGGLYYVLMRVPGLAVFRAPSRYILLLHLALAILAAVMMADLLRLARRRRGRPRPLVTLWPLGLVPGLSLIALAAHAWIKSDPDASPWAAYLWPVGFGAVGAVLILAATAFLIAAFRGVRWAPWCLAVLTVADLTLWGYSFIWRERPQPSARLAERFPEPPGGPQDGRVHVTGGMGLYGNALVMRGYRLASGYVGLSPARTLSPDDPTAQRLLGVRWVFRDGRWSEVADPLARARLVADAVVTADVAGSLGSIDVRRTALVSLPVGDLGPRPDGTATITRDDPGLIEIQTVSLDRQLLVLSEAYSPGWKAAEDGRDIPVYRAYGDLQACLVNPGTHHIVFTFAPGSFVLGAWLSGCALLWVALSCVAGMLLGR